MARAYSGVLGSLALCLAILRGLLLDLPTNDCLTEALVIFFCFAGLGYGIGIVAEQTVRDSVEKRFREEVAKLEPAQPSEKKNVGD